MKRACLLAVFVWALALPCHAQQEIGELRTTIGMSVRIEEVALPGSKLRAKPVTDPQKAEAIVRLLNVFPHGSGWRYNIEVTPLVSGSLDVRRYLERADGSSIGDLPEMPLVVTAVLPSDQLKPNDLDQEEPEKIGGYQLLLIVGGIVWVLGLLAIVFVGRRRPNAEEQTTVDRPLTLAERLRPLVESAREGSLDSGRRAELERLILEHWRQRRSLDDIKVGAAITMLRRDDEAGPLLRKLEEWLHSPDAGDDIDVGPLLEPYRDIPASPRESA